MSAFSTPEVPDHAPSPRSFVKETSMSEAELRAEAFDLRAVDEIIAGTVAPAAAEVDRAGAFPRAALDAFRRAGLLGLIST